MEITQDLDQVPLKKVNVEEGNRTLGMKLEPALNFNAAKQFIIEKMEKFQMKMYAAPFSGVDAAVAYRSFFSTAVYYGTEAVSFTPKQCQAINKTWTIPWLHRLIFLQTMKTQVRHMLKEDAGLELFNIEDIMAIKKIKILLGHLHLRDRVGTQIKSNIIQSQIYSGLDKSILQEKVFYKPLWVEEITQQFYEMGAKINIQH